MSPLLKYLLLISILSPSLSNLSPSPPTGFLPYSDIDEATGSAHTSIEIDSLNYQSNKDRSTVRPIRRSHSTNRNSHASYESCNVTKSSPLTPSSLRGGEDLGDSDEDASDDGVGFISSDFDGNGDDGEIEAGEEDAGMEEEYDPIEPEPISDEEVRQRSDGSYTA